MRPLFPPFALLLVMLAVAGCSTTQLPKTSATLTQSAQKADYFQVRIPTRDGKKLAATVYQPELQAGQSAPLIIATHGFGGFRAKRPMSIYGKAILTGEAAIAAWKAGYWVVFYDQRGWGQSGGRVHMMDPDYEVADLSQVIDWSLDHLPGIRRLEDNSPAIGMIGESYGAGVQTLATFTEPRLKALVPLTGWHDMNSLAPNGEFRTGWGAILLSAGAINSGFDVGEMFAKPWNSAFDGTVSQDMQALLYERSPASFCDKGMPPMRMLSLSRASTTPSSRFRKPKKCGLLEGARQGCTHRWPARRPCHAMADPAMAWLATSLSDRRYGALWRLRSLYH